MKRLLLLLVLFVLIAAPVQAQDEDDAALLVEIDATLRALEDLDRYTVTWEIDITEWIAFWDDDVLTAGIDREIAITYTDHFLADAEHFTFQRLVTVTEERLHEDETVTYTVEIRIVEGVIYIRAEVLEGEMSTGYPREWAEWRYPDQWRVLEDLLPHTYFAAVEMNSPLPLFDLTPDTITALTTDPTYVMEKYWTWADAQARQVIVEHSGTQALNVLPTRPSFNANDPYDLALLDYPAENPDEQVVLYFDREQPDLLMGIEDNRVIEAYMPRSAFEDGAPDSLWLYVFNQRLSDIEFRDLDADFEPVSAPEIE